MDILSIKGIEFHGAIGTKRIEDFVDELNPFSYEFSFGKSYLLDADMEHGGWALSWIIGCRLKPNRGEILLNGIPYDFEVRKKDVWCVHWSEIKRFGFLGNQTVRSQVAHGLKTLSNPFLKSEKEVIEKFGLTLERYNRPFRQISNEAWRASCAVGIANSKKIFCFPNMEFLRPDFYEKFYLEKLKELLDLVKASDALVLVPAKATKGAENLCDEIVPIR